MGDGIVEGGPMLGRAVRSVLLVAFAWLVVETLPSIARYLRMREM